MSLQGLTIRWVFTLIYISIVPPLELSLEFIRRLFGLVPSGLHVPSLVLGALGKRNTQLKQLGNNGGEVLEEQVVVLGILFGPGLELLVLDEDHVGGKHHEGLGGLVLVLQRTSQQVLQEGKPRKRPNLGYIPAWGRSTSSTATSLQLADGSNRWSGW